MNRNLAGWIFGAAAAVGLSLSVVSAQEDAQKQKADEAQKAEESAQAEAGSTAGEASKQQPLYQQLMFIHKQIVFDQALSARTAEAAAAAPKEGEKSAAEGQAAAATEADAKAQQDFAASMKKSEELWHQIADVHHQIVANELGGSAQASQQASAEGEQAKGNASNDQLWQKLGDLHRQALQQDVIQARYAEKHGTPKGLAQFNKNRRDARLETEQSEERLLQAQQKAGEKKAEEPKKAEAEKAK